MLPFHQNTVFFLENGDNRLLRKFVNMYQVTSFRNWEDDTLKPSDWRKPQPSYCTLHFKESELLLYRCFEKPFIHSFSQSVILWSVLGQVYSLFQSEFFAESGLVLPVPISYILCFSLGHPVSACLFFLVFPSFLSFFVSYLQWRVSEGCFYAKCNQSIYPTLFLFYLGYSSPPWFYVQILHFS